MQMLLAVLVILGLCLGQIQSAFAEEIVVNMTSVNASVYSLEGRFNVNVPAKLAWQVLSNYEGIPKFVRSMRSSKIQGFQTQNVLVSQEIHTWVFPLLERSYSLLLKVREFPYQKIMFEDVSYKDFDLYRGSWSIIQNAGESQVIYALNIKAREPFPFLMEGVLTGKIRELLQDVKTEIDRQQIPIQLTEK